MTPLQRLKALYDLEMMETDDIGMHIVTRVPGGWLFKSITSHRRIDLKVNGSESMVFVPYIPE